MNTDKVLKALGLLVLLAVIILLLMKSCNKKSNTTSLAPITIDYKWITDSTKAATLQGAEEDFAVVEQMYLDSIAKLYKTKVKYIKQIFTVTQKLNTDLKPTTDTPRVVEFYTNSDCPKNLQMDFSDEFYDAAVQIGDSSWMHLQGVDYITGVWTKKGNYFDLTVSNTNPHIMIGGLTAFRSPEVKQKLWSIGLQAGYGAVYGSNKQVMFGPYIGIGINRSLIRF